MITSIIMKTHKRQAILFVLFLAALTVYVSLANLLFPEDSFFHIPTSSVLVYGKYVCYALLALSIDLVWGYCGILSLGHGAFFALGGYAMGMHLMREIGDRGKYAHPTLPDFMVFLKYEELPWFWYGFDKFWFMVIMVFLVPGILAFVFGWFAFRSRVTGVYLSIITQALTFTLYHTFFENSTGFGGNNGLTDFKDVLGFNLLAQETRVGLFVLSMVALIIGYIICRYVVTSKLGKILISVRDAESRLRFLGYRTESYKLFVFVLSALMAGVAGALYVPQVGIINPSEFAPTKSIEAAIWVAVGGRGTLIGAVAGTFLVKSAESWFTTELPNVWLFVLGGIFIMSTLFLKNGIMGRGDKSILWVLAGAVFIRAIELWYVAPGHIAIQIIWSLAVGGLLAFIVLRPPQEIAASWRNIIMWAIIASGLFNLFMAWGEAKSSAEVFDILLVSTYVVLPLAALLHVPKAVEWLDAKGYLKKFGIDHKQPTLKPAE